MAISPEELTKFTKEDDDAVIALESYADSILLTHKGESLPSEIRIVFTKHCSTFLLSSKPNMRLNALMQRYRAANWGEVNGGIMGDGTAVMTLRRTKRTYSER